jgi:DNA-binding transcriptional ArsR family regulator
MVDLVAPQQVFAALGDERRTTIVALLAQSDRTVSELAATLPITLQGTLKHLGVLEQAGLVSRTKQGRTVTVHLEQQRLADAEAWLHRTRTFWTGQLAGLAASFEEQ